MKLHAPIAIPNPKAAGLSASRFQPIVADPDLLIPRDKRFSNSRAIISLTGAERMDYCEWQTATLGGEGHAFECGPFYGTLSVDSCVKDFANLGGNCVATYGNLQACTTIMSKDCSNVVQMVDCQKVFMCGGLLI